MQSLHQAKEEANCSRIKEMLKKEFADSFMGNLDELSGLMKCGAPLNIVFTVLWIQVYTVLQDNRLARVIISLV